jgi:hypothetical protein
MKRIHIRTGIKTFSLLDQNGNTIFKRSLTYMHIRKKYFEEYFHQGLQIQVKSINLVS